jgi:short-subunit dehydrogenase
MGAQGKQDFLEKYGPWAVITGASDGIGRGIAFELARRGLNLIIIARRDEKLKALSNEIQAVSPVKIVAWAMDVSDPKSIEKIIELSKGHHIGLFAGVAGFGTSGQFIESDLDAELNMIDVNCRAIVAQTQHFARLFKKNGHGGIILMGSLVGFQGVPYSATYAASKAFIQSFGEGLHFELKPFGVDVLCSAPGPVFSGFAGRAHMNMTQAATPSLVAQKTVGALGSKLTVRPGSLSKLLGWSLIALPRYWRIRMMKIIMGKMARS